MTLVSRYDLLREELPYPCLEKCLSLQYLHEWYNYNSARLAGLRCTYEAALALLNSRSHTAAQTHMHNKNYSGSC